MQYIMEKIDSLKREDEVKVTILGPDNSVLYENIGSGFHNIESALKATLENADLQIDPEDCVFVVNNETSGVSHKYRFNAHGNLKLIV